MALALAGQALNNPFANPNNPHPMSSAVPQDDLLFLGTHGHVIAIDKKDGSTCWEVSLPRTGYQVVTMILEDGVLLCGTAGRVFGLDPQGGSILWDNQLPGRGHGVVAMCTSKQSTNQSSASAAFVAQKKQQAAGS